jgi:hypothetical protein
MVILAAKKNEEAHMAVQARDSLSDFVALVATLTNRENNLPQNKLPGWELTRCVKFNNDETIWPYPFLNSKKVAEIWGGVQTFSLNFLWSQKKEDAYFSHIVSYKGTCLKPPAGKEPLRFSCTRMQPITSFTTYFPYETPLIDTEISTAGFIRFLDRFFHPFEARN